jgi:hypothetical protein
MGLLRARVVICAVALSGVCVSSRAFAQTACDGRLLVTVVTGGVIPDATVTIVGLEATTKASVAPPIHTGEQGLATIEHLVPGRYSAGRILRLRDGAAARHPRAGAATTRQLPVLPLKKLDRLR